MKVDFNDIEFGCFEPHFEIEFGERKYRAIEVNLTLDDGTEETHIISERELGCKLFKTDTYDGIDCSDLDNRISYYADNNDGVYYILECITSEEIK